MKKIGHQLTEVIAPCKTALNVVYTNDCNYIPVLLGNLRQWHDADEHNKFLGLDLEYTADGRDVAVIQIAYKNRVMVFQWSRYV